MNICLCGTQADYPHNEFCPWPYYGNIYSKQADDWQAEWEKKRKTARLELGINGCCKHPLVDDNCMWPVCELYVPKKA